MLQKKFAKKKVSNTDSKKRLQKSESKSQSYQRAFSALCIHLQGRTAQKKNYEKRGPTVLRTVSPQKEKLAIEMTHRNISATLRQQ